MKILFVDDDPAIRDLWKDQREEAGIDIEDVKMYGCLYDACYNMGVASLQCQFDIMVCDGELPLHSKDSTPRYANGIVALQEAKDCGIHHRIVVSGADGYCLRCVAEGLATETAKKEDVVALVAEIVKAAASDA